MASAAQAPPLPRRRLWAKRRRPTVAEGVDGRQALPGIYQHPRRSRLPREPRAGGGLGEGRLAAGEAASGAGRAAAGGCRATPAPGCGAT